jgi:hypothetical protein
VHELASELDPLMDRRRGHPSGFDPQHSPKISNASSKIGRSSGKIGQLRIPRPSWRSTFGSGILLRFISQSTSFSHKVPSKEMQAG